MVSRPQFDVAAQLAQSGHKTIVGENVFNSRSISDTANGFWTKYQFGSIVTPHRCTRTSGPPSSRDVRGTTASPSRYRSFPASQRLKSGDQLARRILLRSRLHFSTIDVLIASHGPLAAGFAAMNREGNGVAMNASVARCLKATDAPRSHVSWAEAGRVQACRRIPLRFTRCGDFIVARLKKHADLQERPLTRPYRSLTAAANATILPKRSRTS